MEDYRNQWEEAAEWAMDKGKPYEQIIAYCLLAIVEELQHLCREVK